MRQPHAAAGPSSFGGANEVLNRDDVCSYQHEGQKSRPSWLTSPVARRKASIESLGAATWCAQSSQSMRLPDALQSTVIRGARRCRGSRAGSRSRICGNGSRPCRRRLSGYPAQRSSSTGITTSGRCSRAMQGRYAAQKFENQQAVRDPSRNPMARTARPPIARRTGQSPSQRSRRSRLSSAREAPKPRPPHGSPSEANSERSATPARHSRARSATTQARATRDRPRPGAIAISQTAYLLQWTRREHPRRRRPGARSGRAMRKRTAQRPRARTSSTLERGALTAATIVTREAVADCRSGRPESPQPLFPSATSGGVDRGRVQRPARPRQRRRRGIPSWIADRFAETEGLTDH